MKEYQLRFNTIELVQFTIDHIEEIKTLLGNQFEDYYPLGFNNSGDKAELWFYNTPQDIDIENDTVIIEGDYIYQVSPTYFISIPADVVQELFITK